MKKCIFSLIAIIVLQLQSPSSLLAQPIPPNDNDLDKILTEIGKVESKVNEWKAMDCPKIDCAEMQAFNHRLRDAMMYVKHMHFWLKRAGDAQMQHLMDVSNQTRLATERAAKVQKILAWQTFFHRLGSALLDIASVAGAFDEIANDPKLFESKTHAEMLDLIDKFYEGMKDAESLKNTLDQGRTDRDFPKPIADMIPDFAGLSSGEWNDVKSTLSDLKSIMEAANRYNNDWKRVLKQGRGFASAGQIIGRVLKSISESEIKERSKLVDNLLRDIVAQDAVQTASYRDLQRIQVRRNKAEDAYLGLKRLIIISGAEGTFTRWLLKYNNRCSFDLGYTSRINLPAVASYSDYNYVSDADKAKSYGSALLYMNGQMPAALNLLGSTPAVRGSVSRLEISKTEFKPNEDINANFKAAACYPGDSWVGVVRSSIAHNNEELNASSVIGGKSYLNRREEGTMLFKAPEEAGNYELRMYELENGKEVAVARFRVKAPNDIVTTATTDVGLSDWGMSATGYRGQIGRRYTFRFGPGRGSGTVWGTGTYTDDSPIAMAAVHAGLITFERGGTVTIEIRAGLEKYKGSAANGINTSDYNSWPGSYVFVR